MTAVILSGSTLTKNHRDEWVPVIPEPLTALRAECMECGAKFWTREGYRAHYALAHILHLDRR